jgi:hypothetical protein
MEADLISAQRRLTRRPCSVLFTESQLRQTRLRRIHVPGGIFGRMKAGFQRKRPFDPLACDETF